MRNPPDEYQKQYPCEVPFRMLDDSEKLRVWQILLIAVVAVAVVYLGGVVAHGIYLWMVQ
jgi:hypothetical protein